MKKILLFIGLIVILVGGIILIPYFNKENDMRIINYKVSMVNRMFSNKVDISKVKKEVNTLSVHSNYSVIEKSVNKYLLDLISVYDDTNNIINNKEYQNMFLVNKIDKNEEYFIHSIELMKGYRLDLIENRDLLKRLANKDIINSYIDKSYLDDYWKFISKIDYNYIEKLDENINDLDKEIIVYDYLLKNIDSWEINNNYIEFNKRVNYNEYKLLDITNNTTKLNVILIDDKNGPDINGSDIIIYENQSVSLNEKIKCIDSVDGEVECSFNGNYDNTKVGNYPITVKAIDTSGNISERIINMKVLKVVSDKPYSIDVIRNQNVVIVYGLDENSHYTKVMQVFTCSTGRNTPIGTFKTSRESVWGSLYGGVWGQYTTRIVGDILFHSVPYYSQNKGDLEWEEYNKLGTQASMGCVRLSVRDVKWIYDNCPSGTTVNIYDGELPNGISKPSTIIIDGNNPNRGWDPTDDDSNNPWR